MALVAMTLRMDDMGGDDMGDDAGGDMGGDDAGMDDMGGGDMGDDAGGDMGGDDAGMDDMGGDDMGDDAGGDMGGDDAHIHHAMKAAHHAGQGRSPRCQEERPGRSHMDAPMMSKKKSKKKMKSEAFLDNDDEWIASVKGMMNSNPNQKYDDGFTRYYADSLLPPEEKKRQPGPGDVGYAPQGRDWLVSKPDGLFPTARLSFPGCRFPHRILVRISKYIWPVSYRLPCDSGKPTGKDPIDPVWLRCLGLVFLLIISISLLLKVTDRPDPAIENSASWVFHRFQIGVYHVFDVHPISELVSVSEQVGAFSPHHRLRQLVDHAGTLALVSFTVPVHVRVSKPNDADFWIVLSYQFCPIIEFQFGSTVSVQRKFWRGSFDVRSL
jgi:hypothetical protein